MLENDYNGPERRIFKRLDIDCAIGYQILSNDLRPFSPFVDKSFSENISAGGIKFLISEKIAEDSFLKITIKLPTAGKPIIAVVKVARCKAKDEKQFEIAGWYIWINNEDKKLINEYIRIKKREKEFNK